MDAALLRKNFLKIFKKGLTTPRFGDIIIDEDRERKTQTPERAKKMTDITQKIIEAKNNGYRYFGIRTGRVAEIGEELECSHGWNYENDCESEELLDGTCATGFNGSLWFDGEEDDELVEQAIALNKKRYGGDMQYVIAGYDSEYGNDEQEVIISGATVIAIIG